LPALLNFNESGASVGPRTQDWTLVQACWAPSDELKTVLEIDIGQKPLWKQQIKKNA
jgi:hypothetical protein